MKRIADKVELYDGTDGGVCFGPYAVVVDGISLTLREADGKRFTRESLSHLSDEEFDVVVTYGEIARTRMGNYRTCHGQGLDPIWFPTARGLIVISRGEWQPGRYTVYLESAWDLEHVPR